MLSLMWRSAGSRPALQCVGLQTRQPAPLRRTQVVQLQATAHLLSMQLALADSSRLVQLAAVDAFPCCKSLDHLEANVVPRVGIGCACTIRQIMHSANDGCKLLAHVLNYGSLHLWPSSMRAPGLPRPTMSQSKSGFTSSTSWTSSGAAGCCTCTDNSGLAAVAVNCAPRNLLASRRQADESELRCRLRLGIARAKLQQQQSRLPRRDTRASILRHNGNSCTRASATTNFDGVWIRSHILSCGMPAHQRHRAARLLHMWSAAQPGMWIRQSTTVLDSPGHRAGLGVPASCTGQGTCACCIAR